MAAVGRRALAVLAVICLVVMVGALSSISTLGAALVGVAAVGAGLALRFRGAVLVIVLASAYGVQRLGPTSANLSVADAVLVLGSLAAVPFAPWGSRRLRQLLWTVAGYQAMLALVVLAHPSARAFAEWGHRILLVAGAVLVGAALARTGRVTAALRIFVVVSAAVSVAAVSYTVARHLSPAYPFGIQKNAVGLVLAFGFVTSMVAPRWVNLPPRLLNPLRIVIVVGLLATQSRGAMLATVAVLAVLQLRSRHSRRGVALVIVATLAMGGVTLAVTQTQENSYKANPGSAQFSGIGARVVTYKQALTIWSSDKLLGAGLRYFRVLSFNTTEPHDVAIEALAESGVVGVVGLAVLLTGAWLALRRLDGELATLARCALWVHFLASLFDIYWVAGRASFPWILVGMALGAQGLDWTRAPRPRVAARAAV